MLSDAHIACIAVSLILVQSINIHAAPEETTRAVDHSVASAHFTVNGDTADLKIQELERKLLEAAEKHRKLINICYRMRAKRVTLDLEHSQLTSDNIVLREKLDYQELTPCPWAIIAGNITGTSADKLNDICNGVSPSNGQNSSKRSKRHAKQRNRTVPCEKPLDPDDQTLALSLTDVAFALQDAGRHEEAEPLFAWALMIIYADRAGNHLPTATALKNLAGLYLDMNAYTKAESAYRRALAEYRYVFDDDHPKLASIQNMLAASLRGQKNYLEAEEMYLKSIATYNSAYGSSNLRLVAPIHNLSQLYLELERYKDAAMWLQQAKEIVKQNKNAKTYREHLEETQRRLNNAMAVHEQDVAKKDFVEKEEEP